MDAQKLPIELKNKPLLEAIIEIRFSSQLVPDDGILGMVLSKLNSVGIQTKVDKLPITQIPLQIINSDLNLKYQPWYKLTTDRYPNSSISIGPRVLSVQSNKTQYTTWEVFFKDVSVVLEMFLDLKIVNKVERVALRYVNFFNSNLFKGYDFSKLQCSLNIASWGSGINTQIQSTFTTGDVLHALRLFKNMDVIINDIAQRGDIIDIDSFKELTISSDPKEITKIINEVHTKNKEIFFSILGEEITKILDPIYEESRAGEK